MDKESIDIKINDDELTIQAKGARAGVEPESYHRMERGYGTFSRSFSLTKTIDPSKIKAAVKDGILRIELPEKGRGQTETDQDRPVSHDASRRVNNYPLGLVRAMSFVSQPPFVAKRPVRMDPQKTLS